MSERSEWVLLAYRVPREPSTPRITIWRKLRRLGVAQIVDGLVALPLDARNREQIEWLCDEIREADGNATVWLATLGTVRDERDLKRRMARAVAEEYLGVIEAAKAAQGETDTAQRRMVGRLRRELRRIEQRDYFPAPERGRARKAVDALATVTMVEA